MSEAKHTPGPWTVEIDGTLSAVGPIITANHAERDLDDPIAELGTAFLPIDYHACVSYESEPGAWKKSDRADIELANARLIAAAPELLDALKEIVSIGMEYYDMEAGDNGGPAIESALAVIAKAEGREG